MRTSLDNDRLNAAERLLREQGPAPLSPDFRRNVLEAVERLPAPELLATPRSPRLLALCAAMVLALGVLALSLPYGSAALAAWQLDLSQTSLLVSVDGSVMSASLLSVAAFALGAAAIVFAGAYGLKHRLISA